MAFDERLAERIRDLLASRAGVTEKKMFGGIAFMLHGNMTVGIVGTDLMVRVGPDQWAAALQRAHAREMDFTGRSMKGFVYVDGVGIRRADALRRWIDLGLAFTETLPRKHG